MKQISMLIFGALLLFSLKVHAYHHTIPGSLCEGYTRFHIDKGDISSENGRTHFRPVRMATFTCPLYKFTSTSSYEKIFLEYFNRDDGADGGTCWVFARSSTGTFETSSAMSIPTMDQSPTGLIEIENLPQPSSPSAYSLYCIMGGGIGSIGIEE